MKILSPNKLHIPLGIGCGKGSRRDAGRYFSTNGGGPGFCFRASRGAITGSAPTGGGREGVFWEQGLCIFAILPLFPPVLSRATDRPFMVSFGFASLRQAQDRLAHHGRTTEATGDNEKALRGCGEMGFHPHPFGCAQGRLFPLDGGRAWGFTQRRGWRFCNRSGRSYDKTRHLATFEHEIAWAVVGF